MSLFAGNKDVMLTFFIVLKDPATLAALQKKYPSGVNRAPYDPNVNGTGVAGGASVEFGAPWKGSVEGTLLDAPFSWSPWVNTASLGAGGDLTPFPTNVASFKRHTGGFWGIGGTDTTYHWVSVFKLAEPLTLLGGVPTYPNIPKRRWVEGFEVPSGGLFAGVAYQTGMFPSRDASRHVGGMGLALRNPSNASQIALTRLGGVGTSSWERIYIRLRRKPDASVGFWAAKMNGAPAAGIELQMQPDGHIAVYNIDNVSTHTLIGTLPTALTEWTGRADDHAWHRLDLLIVGSTSPAIKFDGVAYGTGSGQGLFRVYMDGKSVFQVTGAPIASGLTAGGGVVNSNIGQTGGASPNNLELDLDDWINSDIPTLGAPASFNPNGKDFMTGSKVQLLRPKAFGPNHNILWVGDIRLPVQNPTGVAAGAASMTSATANAIAEVNVDDAIVLDADAAKVGVAAFVVCAQTTRGATSGKAGYTLNAGAPVDTAVVESNIRAYTTVLYTLDGTTTDPKVDITPIALRFTKGNAADAATLQTLLAQVETLGLWGQEDYRVSETPAGSDPIKFENFVGQHNAPYPRSVYASAGSAPPLSPYIVKSGTYVGNGTGLDLTFRAPVNWLYIRNTASNVGFMWHSTMFAAHALFQQTVDAEIVDAQEDLTFVPGAGQDVQTQQYRVRIAGASTPLNALGVTYQYIAVSDPGMRFMLNGSFSRGAGITQDLPLINPTFLAEFMFLWGEDNSGGLGVNLYGKGAGNAAATVTKISGAVLANALAFAAGKLTTQTALTSLGLPHWPFSLWRKHDGNNDPGEGAVFAHGTWTGDGSASRSITFASNGKRPIWVMVFPESGAGAVRDVSHTGTNSTTSANANTATGITGGGLDSFSVGAALNTNGVIYNYFVLIGDATAGNGGFGVNGEFIPVQADLPTDGPFTPQPNLDDILAADGTGGSTTTATIPDDITTDLLAACKPFTTAICNLALSRIGVSKKIVDLATDVTEEAETCRTHLGIDIGQTLRDHPWPFATRYATLVLVAGTSTVPVNPDWQYSYRAPADMIFARRVCGQAAQQRHYDPDPIQFREGSDDTGNLIYTNASNAQTPVVLEYTVRLGCPSGSGDPLFRSALAWRLAGSIAPSLSRDAKKWQDCMSAYQLTLAEAAAKAMGEKQDAPGGDADWIGGRN